MLRWGIIGTVVTALCCFTPILIIALSALGLSAVTGYLDLVLLPVLALFVVMTLIGLIRRRQSNL